MKSKLADIVINEKQKLNGFQVLGVFPFYLKYIRTETHIELSKIREQIQQITKEPKLSDFYNYEIQKKAIPLINKYCVTALVNRRAFGWVYKFLLNRKIKQCSHQHILNLYRTILNLDQPAFFLSYWISLHQEDNTLLSEVKQ